MAASTAVRKIAIMAMLDSKSTAHVTIDVVLFTSQKELDTIIQNIVTLLKQNMITKINLRTDSSHFPKFLLDRARQINPNSFTKPNANGTMTGSFSRNVKVMLLDSPEIGVIRNGLTKCCNPTRPSQTAVGKYVPHRFISSWQVASSLPKGTVFESKRIVLREIGKNNVAEISL